jgi:hypothetical protein
MQTEHEMNLKKKLELMFAKLKNDTLWTYYSMQPFKRSSTFLKSSIN